MVNSNNFIGTWETFTFFAFSSHEAENILNVFVFSHRVGNFQTGIQIPVLITSKSYNLILICLFSLTIDNIIWL